MDQINLYDAKTHLSGWVDRAAAGGTFVIAKNGGPLVQLGLLPAQQALRKPANALGLT